MNDIVFEMMNLVVMIAAAAVSIYLVPWLKEKIGTDKLAQIEKWVKYAVEMAQQVYEAEPGEERKGIVLEFVENLMIAKNISITDEQLNVLIESAVKEMKMNSNE